jgi:hypothetical protein
MVALPQIASEWIVVVPWDRSGNSLSDVLKFFSAAARLHRRHDLFSPVILGATTAVRACWAPSG